MKTLPFFARTTIVLTLTVVPALIEAQPISFLATHQLAGEKSVLIVRNKFPSDTFSFPLEQDDIQDEVDEMRAYLQELSCQVLDFSFQVWPEPITLSRASMSYHPMEQLLETKQRLDALDSLTYDYVWIVNPVNMKKMKPTTFKDLLVHQNYFSSDVIFNRRKSNKPVLHAFIRSVSGLAPGKELSVRDKVSLGWLKSKGAHTKPHFVDVKASKEISITDHQSLKGKQSPTVAARIGEGLLSSHWLSYVTKETKAGICITHEYSSDTVWSEESRQNLIFYANSRWKEAVLTVKDATLDTENMPGKAVVSIEILSLNVFDRLPNQGGGMSVYATGKLFEKAKGDKVTLQLGGRSVSGTLNMNSDASGSQLISIRLDQPSGAILSLGKSTDGYSGIIMSRYSDQAYEVKPVGGFLQLTEKKKTDFVEE